MPTKKERAREKYRSTKGREPSVAELDSYMAMLPASTFYDCTDYTSGYASQCYDPGPSSYADTGSCSVDSGGF